MRVLVALAAGLVCSAVAQEGSVSEWIAEHAIRLDTVQAGRGFSDLERLKGIVGNAHIVSLGEATHGTREFFRLKHRIVELLASEMGFTVFAMEANMPEAYAVNDYIVRGEGDPARLVKGLRAWPWQSEEVLDMVRWMREFNRSGKGHIEFTGFDMQTPVVAEDVVRKFVATREPEYSASILTAEQLERKTPLSSGRQYATLEAEVPVNTFAGKTIRFSGYIKTEDVAGGAARLWCRADGADSKQLALENMKSGGATATSDWRPYSIDLAVPANAARIHFGIIFPATGTAWFDDLRLQVAAKSGEGETLFESGFEAEGLSGFSVDGHGQEIEHDRGSFHSGSQSLRIRIVPISESVEAWREIARHLEHSAAEYIRSGASQREVDWAAQNARVVMQCMQMRRGEVSRDHSMAENVKWIVAHAPGGKVILWAHNGHISAGGDDYWHTYDMGGVLRKIFGADMVVFGFAFNQGSFRAEGQRNGGIGTFTVPPAPAGSLDAALAATGIPLFAVDLRQASGPVAEWLLTPHPTRGISALYLENAPFDQMEKVNIRRAFDALLFVEKTTPTRALAVAANERVEYRKKPAGDMVEYDDPNYFLSFVAPPSWRITGARHWGGARGSVELSESAGITGGLDFEEANPVVGPQNVEKFWVQEFDRTEAERKRQGIPDYRIDRTNCRQAVINSRQAIECTAEFSADAGRMEEYLAFIYGWGLPVRFSAAVAAEQFANVRPEFERIAESIRTP